MLNKEKTKIPLKNYGIALIICLFAISLPILIFKCYDKYKEKRISESYLLKTNTVKEIKKETTPQEEEYFIYIGYQKEEEIYKLEKNLKKVIDSYQLNDIFYYLDATELKKQENYLEILETNLNLEKNQIKKIPTIIYHRKEKNIIVNREDNHIINAGDFEKILEIYEYSKK